MRIAVALTSAGPRVVVGIGPDVWTSRYTSLREAFEDGLLTTAPKTLELTATRHSGELHLGPIVDSSTKVLCVGHNYKKHILEMGHELPAHPNVFSKFPEAIIGPCDPIVLDPRAAQWDWEAELALVIGRTARDVAVDSASAHIAGYTIANDISARDWQRRSSQWLLGKTFEGTTPVGPWAVTPDELDDPSTGLSITCAVDGIEKQRSSTADLLFDAAYLVSYLSGVLTLRPGDLILTGTPAGVGAARQPAEHLELGQQVVTEIAGLGRLENICVAPGPVSPRF